MKVQRETLTNKTKELKFELDSNLRLIGNAVSDKCVIDDNEDNNRVERTWAGSGKLPKIVVTSPPTPGFAHHH